MATVIVNRAVRIAHPTDAEVTHLLKPVSLPVHPHTADVEQYVPDWLLDVDYFKTAVKDGWVRIVHGRAVPEQNTEAPGSGSERWEHQGWTEGSDGTGYPEDGAAPGKPFARIIPTSDGKFSVVRQVPGGTVGAQDELLATCDTLEMAQTIQAAQNSKAE